MEGAAAVQRIQRCWILLMGALWRPHRPPRWIHPRKWPDWAALSAEGGQALLQGAPPRKRGWGREFRPAHLISRAVETAAPCQAFAWLT